MLGDSVRRRGNFHYGEIELQRFLSEPRWPEYLLPRAKAKVQRAAKVPENKRRKVDREKPRRQGLIHSKATDLAGNGMCIPDLTLVIGASLLSLPGVWSKDFPPGFGDRIQHSQNELAAFVLDPSEPVRTVVRRLEQELGEVIDLDNSDASEGGESLGSDE